MEDFTMEEEDCTSFEVEVEQAEVEVLLTDACLVTENANVGKHIICRNFAIVLGSAQNLPDVRKTFENRVQAKLTIRGFEKTERQTEVDYENGLNPVWNCRFPYTFSEASIVHKNLWAIITLYSKRTLGDRVIGEVNISLKTLFDDCVKGESTTLTCPIKQGNVETSAVLNVSYWFGERFSVKKPSAWKKGLNTGAKLLKMTLLASVGLSE